MHRDPDRSFASRIPDWLIGLVLAILVVAAGFAYLRSIGAGDDPAFESESSEPESARPGFVLWDGTGATFIGMNVLPDDRAAVEQMVAQTGVDCQLGLDEGGALGGIAVPATVFIGENCSVVDKRSEAMFEEDLRDLLEELFGI